ncbi:MAG TPA: hypothetical protein VGC73_05435 [Pyrinomonadaceae bacterium]|jgi:hypothetical protein
MSTPENYFDVARAYASGVRELFSPPTAREAAPDRGELTAVASDQMAGRAEELLAISNSLNLSAAARLNDSDFMVRVDAETKLLAKAATDLEISVLLFDALEAKNGASAAAPRLASPDRASSDRVSIEENLDILLRQEAFVTNADRDRSAGGDGFTQAQVTTAIEDTLDLISLRATKSSQAAVGGLLGLGVAQVASAVGVVGKGAADALGVGEAISRWYGLIRGYAINAYEAVLGLLGSAAQAVSKKVLEWVNDLAGKWTGELKEGKLLGSWLETLYETEATKKDLGAVIVAGTIPPDNYGVIVENAEKLRKLYEQQIKWSDRLLGWLPALSGVATVAIPHGTLLVAALYVTLGGYTIVLGADYVDAPRIKFLNHVAGVRQIVESNLAKG